MFPKELLPVIWQVYNRVKSCLNLSFGTRCRYYQYYCLYNLAYTISNTLTSFDT